MASTVTDNSMIQNAKSVTAAFVLPHLSDKLKFAVKASLSLVLVYMIAFWQGWSNITPALVTIMLIASVGSVGDSVFKGMLRVAGTVIGGVLGMTLIALFPQERMAYLLALSVLVTLVLYLARAFKGDTTVFMLTAMTMMMTFSNGEVDDVFLTGIDKVFMTVFAIAVYTLVGMLLWPVHTKDERISYAGDITKTLHSLFTLRFGDTSEHEELTEKLHTLKNAFSKSLDDNASDMENTFSRPQWSSILHIFNQLESALTLLNMQEEISYLSHPPETYIKGYDTLTSQIEVLFKAIEQSWSTNDTIEIPKTPKVFLNESTAATLNYLQRATLYTVIAELSRLHMLLCTLAHKLNSLNSSAITHFHYDTPPNTSRFLWFNPEHLKGALVTFLIFWTAVYLWITYNPPGGFLVVTLATGLSIITAFTPVKPLGLTLVFTFSFVCTALMYIAVLPHLVYGWELGVFIFFYAFVGFYFIPEKLSIFFLLGLVIMNIANPMHYHFGIFLLTQLVFYLFLSLLIVFYYIPFSTKAEHLFWLLQQRFFNFASHIVDYNNKVLQNRATLWERFNVNYAMMHLEETVAAMRLWADKINFTYFDKTDKTALREFTKECNRLSWLLQMMHTHMALQQHNPLVQAFFSRKIETYLPRALMSFTSKIPQDKENAPWLDRSAVSRHYEEDLARFYASHPQFLDEKEHLIGFNETIALYKSLWRSYYRCAETAQKSNFNYLKESRF